MRKMLAALIGAAASVTMITGAGVASAAAGHPASAHAAVTGTEHFQAVGTSLSGNTSTVVAYGVFNASGTDRSISNRKDIFTFPGGSFFVTHKPTGNRQHFSKVTCSGTFFQRGVYKLGPGRGKYAGINGHGRYKLHGLLVARHTASGCSKRPIAVQTIIRAQGPVTLP
jgi:hypothetical protein